MGNTVLGEARKGPAGADPHQVFATAPPASLTPTIRCEGLRIRTKHFARLATVAETAKIGAVYARDSAGVGVGGAGTESSLRLPYEASPFVPSGHALLQGIFPTRGLNSCLPASPALQADSLPTEPPAKPDSARTLNVVSSAELSE